MTFCLMAAGHYLTNVDLSSKVFGDIHLKAISQKVLMNFSHNMCSEITLEYMP